MKNHNEFDIKGASTVKEHFMTQQEQLNQIYKNQEQRKIKNICGILAKDHIDLEKLKSEAWNGIPNAKPIYRSEVWRLLLDYAPLDRDIRDETINRKRQEYLDGVHHYFGQDSSMSAVMDQVTILCSNKLEDISKAQQMSMSQLEIKQLKQIRIDVFRTQGEIKVFSSLKMQIMMVRILFLWSMRHPASGYVQGINDLVAPLILVFVSEYQKELDPENIY